MADIVLFVFLLFAVALGWVLGRQPDFSQLNWRKSRSQKKALSKLPYDFDEAPDKALDAFIQNLRPDADNLDWHIGLARLMRQQGEIKRATHLHKNLLNSDCLDESLLEQIQFELVEDYLAAGLQDRAEVLLLELLISTSDYRNRYLKTLLDLYQRQQEWQKAIDIAQQLMEKKQRLLQFGQKVSQTFKASPRLAVKELSLLEVQQQLAHFYCQLADQAEDNKARYRYIKQALQTDKGCQRAQLACFELEVAAAQWARAAKTLARLNVLAPELLLECEEALNQYFSQFNADQYLEFLASWAESVALDSAYRVYIQALAEDHYQQALLLLEQRLQEKSSLLLLYCLLCLQCDKGDSDKQNDLSLYRQQLQQLVETQQEKAYVCQQCGYKAQTLRWQCPGCFSWGKSRLLV